MDPALGLALADPAPGLGPACTSARVRTQGAGQVQTRGAGPRWYTQCYFSNRPRQIRPWRVWPLRVRLRPRVQPHGSGPGSIPTIPAPGPAPQIRPGGTGPGTSGPSPSGSGPGLALADPAPGPAPWIRPQVQPHRSGPGSSPGGSCHGSSPTDPAPGLAPAGPNPGTKLNFESRATFVEFTRTYFLSL